jgi:hypothetical protein
VERLRRIEAGRERDRQSAIREQAAVNREAAESKRTAAREELNPQRGEGAEPASGD